MADDGSIACWNVRIHGRVQGVGYRDACVRQAQALGLTGWVRNRSDGTVEAEIRGPVARLDRLLRWLRRGPPSARVDRVELRREPDAAPPPTSPATCFERRPTL